MRDKEKRPCTLPRLCTAAIYSQAYALIQYRHVTVFCTLSFSRLYLHGPLLFLSPTVLLSSWSLAQRTHSDGLAWRICPSIRPAPLIRLLDHITRPRAHAQTPHWKFVNPAHMIDAPAGLAVHMRRTAVERSHWCLCSFPRGRSRASYQLYYIYTPDMSDQRGRITKLGESSSLSLQISHD